MKESWKYQNFMKFHEIRWFFMKIVVSRPSPRRDPRNSMNYCSILHVLGTWIDWISYIFIISLKFMILMMLWNKQDFQVFRNFHENTFSAHARLADTWETTANIKGSGQVGVEVMKIYIFTNFHGISWNCKKMALIWKFYIKSWFYNFSARVLQNLHNPCKFQCILSCHFMEYRHFRIIP